MKILLLLLIGVVLALEAPGFAAREMKLEGVVEDSANPSESMAIVNGGFYKAGDVLGPYRIKSVGSYSLKLEELATGRESVLELQQVAPSPPKARVPPVPAVKTSGPANVKPAAAAGSGKENPIEQAKKILANPAQAIGRISELKALREMALINNAAVLYSGKNGAFPNTLPQLIQNGFLESRYESGVIDQYRFYLSNTRQNPVDFQLHADPLKTDSGLRYFFVGPDAVIRESTGKPATAQSPAHDYPGKPAS